MAATNTRTISNKEIHIDPHTAVISASDEKLLAHDGGFKDWIEATFIHPLLFLLKFTIEEFRYKLEEKPQDS